MSEYIFTDGWQHQIRVGAILAPEPHRRYLLRFTALRQHYFFFDIMERVLKIIEEDGTQDHHEELEALRYRLHTQEFTLEIATVYHAGLDSGI